MLNIAFVSKKNKPGVAEAINWLENFECNIDLFYAEINKPIDEIKWDMVDMTRSLPG